MGESASTNDLARINELDVRFHEITVEAAGSLHAFLAAYLRQVARHGYRHAPFEVDARAAAIRCMAELRS